MGKTTWLVLTNWDVRAVADRPSAKSPWHLLSSDWKARYTDQELSGIPIATYVLTISSPFTVDYPKAHSPVIYIGEGFAHARFKEHLGEKLLPMLQSFAGAKFDFWVLPCDDKQQVVATEARMLEYFATRHGALPLFNVQAGKNSAGTAHPAWADPLDQRRIGKRQWAIRKLGQGLQRSS